MLTKQQLLSMWSSGSVNFHSIYLSLPTTKFPPSFISEMFGEGNPDEIRQELGREIEVLETDHPKLKGQFTTWKVLRVEIYPGSEDCAYDFIAICHCDRLSDSIPPERLEEIKAIGERVEKEKAEYFVANPV